MAKIENVKPGQVLYTVTSGRLGNTTLRTVNVHTVRVISVHVGPEDRFPHVVASWNGNPKQKFYRGEVGRWKLTEPVTVSGIWGAKRLANRDEKAAILAARQTKQ